MIQYKIMFRLIQSIRSRRVFLISSLILIVASCLLQWYVSTSATSWGRSPGSDLHNFVLAKNLAFFRKWGMSKYDFWPAASSIVYPVALAIPFFIFGAHLWASALVNYIFGILILQQIERNLVANNLAPKRQVFIVSGSIFLLSLPTLILSGSEQVLLVFFLLQILQCLRQEWIRDQFSYPVYLYAVALAATRFDSVVVLVCIGVVLAVYRKGLQALFLLMASLIPIVVFGVIAWRKGGAFFDPAIVFGKNRGVFDYYWIAGGVVAFMIPILAAKRMRLPRVVPIISMSVLLLCNVAGTQVIAAGRQEAASLAWQVGQFVHLYYNKYSLAMQDQPIVPWLSEGQKLDLERIRFRATTDSIASKTQAAYSGIAIVKDPYASILPATWKKVAVWQTRERNSNNIDETFFFAIDTFQSKDLKANLERYQGYLHKDISVTYFYP